MAKRYEEPWVPELSDFNLTLEQALEMVVTTGKYRGNTLGWIANNNPAALDKLLDETDPGGLFFHAIVMVNAANVNKIALALRSQNSYRVRHFVPIRKMIFPSALDGDLFG